MPADHRLASILRPGASTVEPHDDRRHERVRHLAAERVVQPAQGFDGASRSWVRAARSVWRASPVSAAASTPLPQTSPTTRWIESRSCSDVVEVTAHLDAGARYPVAHGQIDPARLRQGGRQEAALQGLGDVALLAEEASALSKHRAARAPSSMAVSMLSSSRSPTARPHAEGERTDDLTPHGHRDDHRLADAEAARGRVDVGGPEGGDAVALGEPDGRAGAEHACDRMVFVDRDERLLPPLAPIVVEAVGLHETLQCAVLGDHVDLAAVGEARDDEVDEPAQHLVGVERRRQRAAGVGEQSCPPGQPVGVEACLLATPRQLLGQRPEPVAFASASRRSRRPPPHEVTWRARGRRPRWWSEAEARTVSARWTAACCAGPSTTAVVHRRHDLALLVDDAGGGGGRVRVLARLAEGEMAAEEGAGRWPPPPRPRRGRRPGRAGFGAVPPATRRRAGSPVLLAPRWTRPRRRSTRSRSAQSARPETAVGTTVSSPAATMTSAARRVRRPPKSSTQAEVQNPMGRSVSAGCSGCPSHSPRTTGGRSRRLEHSLDPSPAACRRRASSASNSEILSTASFSVARTRSSLRPPVDETLERPCPACPIDRGPTRPRR